MFWKESQELKFDYIKFEMLWGVQVEMSVKSLNAGEPEFQGQFQATDKNLDVFTIRIIIKTMEMVDII